MDTLTFPIHTVLQTEAKENMSDHNAGPNPSGTTGTRPVRHRTPSWVKGFIIAAAVLVVAIAVMHLTGGTGWDHTP